MEINTRTPGAHIAGVGNGHPALLILRVQVCNLVSHYCHNIWEIITNRSHFLHHDIILSGLESHRVTCDILLHNLSSEMVS
jgi:hypothetical protein